MTRRLSLHDILTHPFPSSHMLVQLGGNEPTIVAVVEYVIASAAKQSPGIIGISAGMSGIESTPCSTRITGCPAPTRFASSPVSCYDFATAFKLYLSQPNLGRW